MKIYKYIVIFILLFVAIAIYTACSSVTYAPLSQNLVAIYSKRKVSLFPEFTVYHYAKDSSRLYFLLKTNELNINNNREKPSVSYKLQYIVYKSYDKNEVLDSNTVSYYNEDVSNKASFIQHDVALYTGNIKQAVLQVKVYDVNESTASSTTLITLNREDVNNRQFYYTTAKGISINDNVHEARYVDIQQKEMPNNPYFVSYYARNFEIAYPPYFFDKIISFNYRPDSVFRLPLARPLNMTGQGFYHVQTDTFTRSGLTLYKFYEGFPNIQSAANLLEPLRYITTEREYELLRRKQDIKAAVDSFWLIIGNDEVRSKDLIKRFYIRVVYANRLFTSYKEGWKTDRGMIYIVYGTPNIVYKTENSESWIYGEEGNMLSLTFTFIKVINPFTDNDFQLNRAPVYQNNWFSAIDHWRDGRPNNEY